VVDVSLENLTRVQLDNCRTLDDKCLIRVSFSFFLLLSLLSSFSLLPLLYAEQLVDIAPNLVYLDIAYAPPRVTDTSIVHIATHAHCMLELYLDYCLRITDEGVLALTQMPLLRVVGITGVNITNASLCALLAGMQALQVVHINRDMFSVAANRRINERFQHVLTCKRIP
jgi:hypothetical protein